MQRPLDECTKGISDEDLENTCWPIHLDFIAATGLRTCHSDSCARGANGCARRAN